MSGIEPGRPKIEEREAGFIVKGDDILLDSGVWWQVKDWTPKGHHVMLHLTRVSSGGRRRWRTFTAEDTLLIRTRVKEEDR